MAAGKSRNSGERPASGPAKDPVPDAGDVAEMAKERKDQVVGNVSDFPAGSHRVVKVGGREIGIFNIEGKFYGLPNVCPHQTGPLCEGKTTGTLIAREDSDWKPQWLYDGEIVVCPWHGLEYHVPSGQCLAYPRVKLRRYEVVVEDEEVKVRL